MNENASEIQALPALLEISDNWPKSISDYLKTPIKCYLSPAILNSKSDFFVKNESNSENFDLITSNGIYLWLLKNKDKDFRIIYVGRSRGQTTDMIIRTSKHFENAKTHVDCIVHRVEDNKLICVDHCNRAKRTSATACLAKEPDVSGYLKNVHVLFLPIPFPDSAGNNEIERHNNAIHELEGTLIAAVINHYNEIPINNSYEYIMNSKGKAFNYIKNYGNDGNLPKVYEAVKNCWESALV